MLPAALSSRISSMMATLACYEGMFGPYNVQTLGLATTLAVALCESGRAEEGKPLLRRALLDLTKHHGPRHPLRMRALEAWCEVLREDGDWTAALVIQRELVESREPAIS